MCTKYIWTYVEKREKLYAPVDAGIVSSCGMREHSKRSHLRNSIQRVHRLDAPNEHGSHGILSERAVRTVVSAPSVPYAFAEKPKNLVTIQ